MHPNVSQEAKTASVTEAAGTVKKQVFDGISAPCLSPFGFTGGKEHREIARNRRSVVPDKPAQPEKRVKGCGP
jgi:hypothetical protein